MPRSAHAQANSDAVAEAERAGPYLEALLAEINARRAREHNPPVAMAPTAANAGVVQYLADLTPIMVSTGVCMHGTGNPVPPSWDYVANTGFTAWPNAEVMACPANNGYWTASRIAETWWASPLHHRILYTDPNVKQVACGTFGPQGSGQAYQTIACVTFGDG